MDNAHVQHITTVPYRQQVAHARSIAAPTTFPYQLAVELRFVFFDSEIIGKTEEVIIGSGVGVGKQ